jgi:hypothetical protein
VGFGSAVSGGYKGGGGGGLDEIEKEMMTAEEVSSLAEALKIFDQAALAADRSIVSSTGSRDRSRPTLGAALKRVEFRMLPLRHQEGLL